MDENVSIHIRLTYQTLSLTRSPSLNMIHVKLHCINLLRCIIKSHTGIMAIIA